MFLRKCIDLWSQFRIYTIKFFFSKQRNELSIFPWCITWQTKNCNKFSVLFSAGNKSFWLALSLQITINSFTTVGLRSLAPGALHGIELYRAFFWFSWISVFLIDVLFQYRYYYFFHPLQVLIVVKLLSFLHIYILFRTPGYTLRRYQFFQICLISDFSALLMMNFEKFEILQPWFLS